MIFIKSDNGYQETNLKEGDAVILFTDENRVAFWRDKRYLFWSLLPELPTLLFPVTDIKLFYDFDGGAEEFKEKATSFATKRGFDLKEKEMSFGGNSLGKDIPCIAFEFTKEGEKQDDTGMPQL